MSITWVQILAYTFYMNLSFESTLWTAFSNRLTAFSNRKNMFSLTRSWEFLLVPGLSYHSHMDWNGTVSLKLGKNMIETNQRHTWRILWTASIKWWQIFYWRNKQTNKWRAWLLCMRSVEWSLRAFASKRAVRLFSRAWAVIRFDLRAASTLLENTSWVFRGISLLLKETPCAKKSDWHHSTTDPSSLQSR